MDYRGDIYVAEMFFPMERQDLMVITLTSGEKILVSDFIRWSLSV